MHLKEIKLHPKTDEHDFNFKMGHARRFLLKGDRVKATVVFRGREITHIDFGHKILERLDNCLADLSQVEVAAKMEGRNMISIYVPDKAKIKSITISLIWRKGNTTTRLITTITSKTVVFSDKMGVFYAEDEKS